MQRPGLLACGVQPKRNAKRLAAKVRRRSLTSLWVIYTEHFAVRCMQSITPGSGFQQHITVFAMQVYVPEPRVIYAAAFAGEEQVEKKINGTSCCLFMVVTNPVTHGPR